MALDKSILKAELITWLENPADNIDDSADLFADAYDTYGLDAEDPLANPLLLANRQAIADAFKTITINDTASSSAIKISNGIILYWTGAAFDFVPPQVSSLVTTPMIPTSISATLTTIFSDNSKNTTIDTKATQISDLLDTATKTVIATIVHPPPASPTIGPIT